MSKGPGKLQTLIMEALQFSSVPLSTGVLRDEYEHEICDFGRERDFDVWMTPARRRSVRMSAGRALRHLEAAGEIKRDEEGNWYPAKDWPGRDRTRRQRSGTAYHEAGHAVIGLALNLPIAFATIKPRSNTLGHISEVPEQRSIGAVYARGQWRKPIVDLSKQDVFGNPVSERNRDYHAAIVMSIAGGMAQCEFLKDGRTWDKLEGTSGDRRNISYDRRKLGYKARPIADYEAQCAELIKRHWPMIEAVAEKLLKEETLSGSDVYDICWRTSRNVVRRQHLKPKRGKR